MNLFSGLIGCLSVAVNKRGTFINFAMQYLKHADISYAHLMPYLPMLVTAQSVRYSRYPD